MADVFLSYASADVDLARRLEQVLVAADYSVWWDHHLLSGARYEESIKRELAGAVAVLVVWTAASVRSDWVYSEARRGHERRVLVQVRERDIIIDDLPAPFDAFHCPFADDDEAMLRAVSALVSPNGAPNEPARMPAFGLACTRSLLVAEPVADPGATLLADNSDDRDRLVARVRAICRTAGGSSFDLPGGVTAAVFDRPEEALRAASEAQHDGASNVRLGVHTGLPTAFEDTWIGMDVTRTTCMASAAHPGQVVVSATTAKLVGDQPGMALRDLGVHGFTGLARPEHLYELVPDSGPSFPPLRTLGSLSRLPTSGQPFLGRIEDLTELDALFERGRERLVTLTGPGGIGKTSLAVAVAERVAPCFPAGVFFVPLEQATDAAEIWAGVAGALGLSPQDQDSDAVVATIANRVLLLVLDNLEQAADADDVVRELCARCEGVRVLATSRRPLHVLGEHEHAVLPLDLETDAVELFARQARLVKRGFEVTAENRADILSICAALDGVPLALELAAARSRLLAPRALLKRIDAALDLGAHDKGRPDRQRTLRATMQWSYDLLTDEEQRLLRTLGVFTGPASLPAVEFVNEQLVGFDADTVERLEVLIGAALADVESDDAAEPRIRLLNLTSAFARDQLRDRDELDATHAALARWCDRLVDHPDRWTAPSEEAWVRSAGIAREMEHIRASLAWLLDKGGAERDPDLPQVALRLAGFFAQTVVQHSQRPDARRWLNQALELDDGRPTVELAQALLALSVAHVEGGDVSATKHTAEQASKVLAQVTGDHSLRFERTSFWAAVAVAKAKMYSGDLDGALSDYTALRVADRPAYEQARILGDLSYLAAAMGDPEEALRMETEAGRRLREVGWLGDALLADGNRACSLRELGRASEALTVMHQVVPLALAQSPRTGSLPPLAEDYAAILIDVGDAEAAALIWGSAAEFRRSYDLPADAIQVAETAESLTSGREQLGETWDELVARGAGMDLEELLLVTAAERG